MSEQMCLPKMKILIGKQLEMYLKHKICVGSQYKLSGYGIISGIFK